MKRKKIEDESKQESMFAIQNVFNEETVVTEDQQDDGANDQCFVDTHCHSFVQCELLNNASSRWNIEMFQKNDKAISYHTGLSNFEHFNFVFNFLGLAAHDLNMQCYLLSLRDQFFSTWMKLMLRPRGSYQLRKYKLPPLLGIVAQDITNT